MRRINKLLAAVFLASLLCQYSWGQAVELVPVVARPISRTVELPGEFQPFLSVSLHSRVTGYVERVLVDRGSMVKQGDLLIELSAPEMKAQIAEAESKVQSMEAERLQAAAQLAGAESTFDRMKKAAETPGAIAGNELVQAEKQMEGVKALLNSRDQAVRAAQGAVQALKTMEEYLKITAPFEGVVTDRLVHPGALVGPGSDSALLVVQQISRLRLVVAVPEESVGGIAAGASVSFQTPAYPERTFTGTVSRIAHSLDPRTRTMPVEMDVLNTDHSLSPGMYPTVKWPVRRTKPSLFVPKTSIVTTTERTFVIRQRSGRAEWVDVRKGAADGDLVEVLGPLQAGDLVVKRASDELREGAPLSGSSK